MYTPICLVLSHGAAAVLRMTIYVHIQTAGLRSRLPGGSRFSFRCRQKDLETRLLRL